MTDTSRPVHRAGTPAPAAWAPPSAPPPQAAAPSQSAPPSQADDASSLLFAAPADVDKALQAQDKGPGSDKRTEQMAKLSKTTRKVAEREIHKAMSEVLGVRFADVVFRAWQKHTALLAAGRRTHEASSREVVALAVHTIKSTHNPQITLTLNGLDAGTINLKLTLTLKVNAVNAVVEKGHLTGIESGAITASASLAVNNSPPTTKTTNLDAVKTLRLERPMPLVKEARVAAAASAHPADPAAVPSAPLAPPPLPPPA